MAAIDELTGVLPALISPLDSGGSVDEAAVARLVDHMIDGGVAGLLALGSTGEGASLDEKARRTMLSSTVAAAAGRVPVICGVAQSHLAAARVEVEAAVRLGAAAALVAPPFYYPMDQATVLAFYRQLAADSPLPLLLYNIPQFTKVVAQPETIATLAREGTIAGIKDSSRDFEYFEAVCIASRELTAFRVFTGSDTMLLPALMMGAAGTICGAANVAPGSRRPGPALPAGDGVARRRLPRLDQIGMPPAGNLRTMVCASGSGARRPVGSKAQGLLGVLGTPHTRRPLRFLRRRPPALKPASNGA
jgi:dihydrodipicolinate synthase/N-acetylneuraminate lyase